MTDPIEPQGLQLVTRAEAVALGHKTFAGVRCRRFGHIERYGNGGGCVICAVRNGSAYRKDNPEQYAFYNKRWNDKHPERRKAIDARWRAANIVADNFAASEYRKNNPEKYLAAVKCWKLANPEAVRAMDNGKRARRKAAPGTHTAAEIRDLFAKQKGKCAHPWCRILLKDGYHVDHIQALARGGTNWISNIQLLCEPCNRKKSAKDRFVFALENGRLL